MHSRIVEPIASHLAEWEVPHVERAIYGTQDPSRIAEMLDDFCRQQLNSSMDRILFYQSSIGAVAGLELVDGRKVVVKAHQPDWTLERLREIAFLQSHIAQTLHWAPLVLRDPAQLGNGFATTEQYVDNGLICNGHDSSVRRALAVSLNATIRQLNPFVLASRLPTHLLASLPAGELWPPPHSKLFDFEAASAGAEYIDEIATAARGRMKEAGKTVIAHLDWRAEHVRFERDTPVAAFDWDSLHVEQEPAIVGTTAHMFCGDWSRTDIAQAPSLEEARAFVSDYELAAGRQFDQEERTLCAATFAYSVAYTSRCGHASGVELRDVPGTFPHLLATERLKLLDL